MRISSAFPSDYLKAADLDGRNVRVLMDRVEMGDIGGDHKPILYFQGKEKGLILNKTNSRNISAAYGEDTDDWFGKEIVLFEAMVDFQGKTVPAIRVRAPTAKDRQQRPNGPQSYANTRPATPYQASETLGGEHYDPAPARGGPIREPERSGGMMDDDIPFAPEWR
jgi:hypothetical protein